MKYSMAAPGVVKNVEEPLAEGELFHFTLDENQENNLFVQVFDQVFQENADSQAFVSQVTNPGLPFVNVFTGFCVRERLDEAFRGID